MQQRVPGVVVAKHYRSKIDLWLVATLASATAITIGALYFAAVVENKMSLWMALLVGLPGVLLPAWILLGTGYVLDQGMLKIRCGPFRSTIPIKDIRHIEPTRSALSSPALSLDRLRIDHGDNKSLMISPRDSKQFLKDLEAMRNRH